MRPSPTRRSTSSSNPKAWVRRSGYRPIGCCKTTSATSSSARSGDRRRRCAATMPAFATKLAHRQSPDEWWPRSSGIRVSFIRASALSSPTWRGRWSVSSPSITTAVPASSTSKKARARSSGPGCHADPSPPTPSRLQLHALAYNLGNFMRTLAMPKTAEPWSLTSLRETQEPSVKRFLLTVNNV
jgi:hypothetical protein